MLQFPKDTAQFSWTRHIKNKMVFYHLSGAQILRIFRKPKRVEEGIAPDTVAAMTPRTPREELWIMYRMNKGKKSRVTMISAWRYPGVTKPGERPTIPEDVLAELERAS